jgi:hypothetical protein
MWIIPLCVLVGGSVPHRASADPPKVERQDNHVVPLMTEITFKDENVPKARVMVFGILRGPYLSSHAWNLAGDGNTSVRVWLDTIAEIKEIDEKRLTVVFKDGTELQFRHEQESLRVYHPNDSTEKVPVAKLRQIKFLRAPRKDQENQAMFDQWRYSPYTGEKLPPVEDNK